VRQCFPAVSQQGSRETDGNKNDGTFMLACDDVANQAEVAGRLFRD
jgi:hypothetical protein